MSDPFDPVTTRALDAFTVPPLSDSFADRMMARIAASPALPELPPLAPPRRDARGGWRRSGIILASVAAFSLVSAAAAAMGIFGTNIRASNQIGAASNRLGDNNFRAFVSPKSFDSVGQCIEVATKAGARNFPNVEALGSQ